MTATEKRSAAKSSRVRQTRKSVATHRRIIEAAIRCFLEIGYHRTTTSEIAKRAKVTRGAVQYYFPTTPEVLRATVEHIQTSILNDFAAEMRAAPAGADSLDLGIETSWELANSALWTVWQELLAAARTDAELRAIMYPAVLQFEERAAQSTLETYPHLHAKDPGRFGFGRQFSWLFLQGLAALPLGAGGEEQKRRLVQELKDLMHDYWGLRRAPAGE